MSDIIAVEDTIRRLVARQIGLDPAAISDGDRLQEDLGLDSIDAAELLVAVNAEHGLVIDPEALETSLTIGDLLGVFRCAVAESDR